MSEIQPDRPPPNGEESSGQNPLLPATWRKGGEDIPVNVRLQSVTASGKKFYEVEGAGGMTVSDEQIKLAENAAEDSNQSYAGGESLSHEKQFAITKIGELLNERE